MLTCTTCGKQNQDNYKFCLGCGARLVTGAGAGSDRGSVAGSPSAGSASANPPPVGAFAVGEPAAASSAPGPSGGGPAVAASPGAEDLACSSCGQGNPAGFRFCGRCGNTLAATNEATGEPGETAPVAPVDRLTEPPSLPTHRASTPAAEPGRSGKARLVLLREDGSEGGMLGLEGGPEVLGREYGPPFDSDAYLDPRHVTLTVQDDGIRVDDLNSLNGVFVKLEARTELRDKDQFRVGQELLIYEDLPEPALSSDGSERMGSPNPGYWGRVSVIVQPGQASEAYPIKEAGLTIGREQGDARFPNDGYVSGRHCGVVGDDTGVYLEDLGSSNGTYLRVRSGDLVAYGRLLLVGQQLFRVEMSSPETNEH
ncbi:MAG: FHA domain-containing protein [Nannocystaceae bacterium]